jgi:DNA-binding IclR family transcriptional regulator
VSSTSQRSRFGRHGTAADDGEYRPETLGIAAPVFVRDHVPAALVLSRPHDCVAYIVDALIERVVTAAAALTGALKQPEPGTDDRSA